MLQRYELRQVKANSWSIFDPYAQNFYRTTIFCNNVIPIITHIGEIIGIDLAVQSSRILNLDVVVVIIKLN